MSKRKDSELLNDIKVSVERIISYTEGLSYENFAADSNTQDAVIRNFEILGEASKTISSVFKEKHQDFPWKQMAATRDKLIHTYLGINLDIVWNIVKN